MLFNSYIFILFFLPITLLGYFGLNYLKLEKAAKVFLVGMSLWFYAYFHVSYLFIIMGSILFNFLCSKGIGAEGISVRNRKIRLLIGILFNVGIIFNFKYFNFFLENINWFFKADFVTKNILMPLGISFFTFQQISYLVDSYRGETKDYSFVDYALFVTFFPQLIAGPIVFHNEMIPQFRDSAKKKINQEKLARGIWIFAVGLFKKVLIADVVGKGADFGFSNVASLSGADSLLVMLCYTLQIYFDFSGYCDMAIGIANMFQMDLPQNFNSPYKADSVTEFWKRWHMTLTRFLRKYVYFPLGGNRKGEGRTLLHILIVYLVSGIWHGAAWTFILWGLLHGIARVFERLFQKYLQKIPRLLRQGLTFLFVNLTWVLFRAGSLKDAVTIYGSFFDSWGRGLQSNLLHQFNVLELTYIEEHVGFLRQLTEKCPWMNMTILVGLALLITFATRNCHEKEFKPTASKAFFSIVLLVWSIISFSGLSTFLYFNF